MVKRLYIAAAKATLCRAYKSGSHANLEPIPAEKSAAPKNKPMTPLKAAICVTVSTALGVSIKGTNLFSNAIMGASVAKKSKLCVFGRMIASI